MGEDDAAILRRSQARLILRSQALPYGSEFDFCFYRFPRVSCSFAKLVASCLMR